MKLIYRNGTENFYMRKEVKGNRITISVSNMKSLWRCKMTEDEILDLFKKQNPLMQSKREKIVECAHSCLDSSGSPTSVTIDDGSKALLLNLVNKVSEFKVKLNLILDIQGTQEFFKEITNPLVAVVNQLMEQRSKLLALVKSKDQELKEYKLEGAEISRKNVETDEIMEKEFLDNSLTEFMDKTDQNQLRTELNLSPDLLQIFTKVSRLEEEVSSSNGAPPKVPLVTSSNGSSMLSIKKEIKRPPGNETIVQVPRSKQRRKNFNL